MPFLISGQSCTLRIWCGTWNSNLANYLLCISGFFFLFSGGHGPVSKYELHGGEKVHTPQGCAIGTREVVGYGNCGQENYVDHVHYPFPAIRFKVIWLIRLKLTPFKKCASKVLNTHTRIWNVTYQMKKTKTDWVMYRAQAVLHLRVFLRLWQNCGHKQKTVLLEEWFSTKPQ